MSLLLWLLLMANAVAFAGGQASGLPPFPAAADIVAVVGDSTAAGGLVSRALQQQLGDRHAGETLTVMSRQMPAEWLPLVPGVRFVLLDDVQAENHWKACGRFLSVHAVAREGDRITLSVGQRNRCSSGGIDAHFSKTPVGWYPVEGIGGGFGGGTGHCECRK